jgi:ABC-type lipoprotein export system ATPase subunit
MLDLRLEKVGYCCYCVVVATHDLLIADAADQVYSMTDGILTAGSA